MYKPNPIDNSDIILSPELDGLIENLAENTHEVWAKHRTEEGWVYGLERNDIKKEHPGLIPYAQLSEKEKDYDRNTAKEAIKNVISLGFSIEKQ